MARFKTIRNERLRNYRNFLKENGFKLINSIDPFHANSETWKNEYLNNYNTKLKHTIFITFDSNFPYVPPHVYTNADINFIKTSRHQNEFFKDGSLICLYHKEDWDISTTPENFLKRIFEWFDRAYRDSWKNTDKLNDLDLHYYNNGILALCSDDFINFQFKDFGFYKYIEAKENNKTKFICMFNPYQCINNNGKKAYLKQNFDCPKDKNIAKIIYSQKSISITYDGLWFKLNAEPKLFRTYNELLQQIKTLTKFNKGEIKQKIDLITKSNDADYYIISLIYANNTSENQFIHFKISKTTKEITTFLTSKCSHECIQERINHLKIKLNDKTISIFGLGALGSAFADSISKCGLKKIILSDFDIMKPENTIRHRLGIENIGENKALAMKKYIENHIFNSTDIVVNYEIENQENITKIIQEVDLVVDCTANKNFSLMLNNICVQNNKAVIYLTTHKKTTVGQIKLVRPNIDPCLCCYYGENGIIDNYIKYNYPYLPKEENDKFITSCGDSTYPGISPDIELSF